MAQVYAQQAKIAGASPDGENSPEGNTDALDNAQSSGGGGAARAAKNDRNDSDVSDEEAGDDLPCKFDF